MKILIPCVIAASAIYLQGCGTPATSSSSSDSSLNVSSSSASSVSSQSSSSPSVSTLIIQETSPALCSSAGAVETDHTGYTDAGYINVANRIGSSLVWQIHVNTPTTVDVQIRYASGGSSNRSADLIINDEASGELTFPPASWTDWQQETQTVYLQTGNNTIRLAATTAEGLANIDRLEIVGGDASAGNCEGIADASQSLTVWIAGDSTVSNYTDTSSPNDQAGWGQMLHEQYNDLVHIENKAVGGRTARRFIDEGRLDEIWNSAQPGDYLLVQFGTNDGHRTATYTINGQSIPYYLDPNTDFKSYLQRYVDGAAARQLQLVFVTPPPRNSAYCTGGNGTGGHAQAMRELAASQGIPVADLNQKSVSYLMAICPAPTPEDFFLLRSNGTVDGTHFQENGARIMSRMVADGIGEASLSLDLYRD